MAEYLRRDPISESVLSEIEMLRGEKTQLREELRKLSILVAGVLLASTGEGGERQRSKVRSQEKSVAEL